MFKAFFDESGTDPIKNKALVVGGFLGLVDEWKRASEAWATCLAEPPAIGYFKYYESQTLAGQFWKFNRLEADKKVLALARVTSGFSILGVCSSVPYRIFEGRDPKTTRGMIGARAYDWGFASCVVASLQHLQESGSTDERVDFVFDRRPELKSNIDLLNSMKRQGFPQELMIHAGECIQGDDKDTNALQMADLLAGEFSRSGETGTMSDAFNLIRVNNRILYLPCRPPRQMNPTLRLYQLGSEIQAEAVKFLKKTRTPNAAWTVEEIAAEVKALKGRETYFKAELGRLLLELDDDVEYQAFKKKYFEGKDFLDL